MALGWPWGGLGVALGGFARPPTPISTFYFLLSAFARMWLWVASLRLKRSRVRDTSRKNENSVIMRIADNKVSDGGQPPMTFRLALRESAGSRLLHHPVCA